MTPEQEQAVQELREAYKDNAKYSNYDEIVKNKADVVITLLSQTQSALEQAQRERDEALSRLALKEKK